MALLGIRRYIGFCLLYLSCVQYTYAANPGSTVLGFEFYTDSTQSMSLQEVAEVFEKREGLLPSLSPSADRAKKKQKTWFRFKVDGQCERGINIHPFVFFTTNL